jgi:hypothetical protein
VYPISGGKENLTTRNSVLKFTGSHLGIAYFLQQMFSDYSQVGRRCAVDTVTFQLSVNSLKYSCTELFYFLLSALRNGL